MARRMSDAWMLMRIRGSRHGSQALSQLSKMNPKSFGSPGRVDVEMGSASLIGSIKSPQGVLDVGLYGDRLLQLHVLSLELEQLLEVDDHFPRVTVIAIGETSNPAGIFLDPLLGELVDRGLPVTLHLE